MSLHHPSLLVHQGLVDATTDHGLRLILYNSGADNIQITCTDTVANILLIENKQPPIQLLNTSKKLRRTQDPQNFASCIAPSHVHEHAADAKLESDLFIAMDMPYDI